ncbi:signal peptidase II [Nakamurella endophytica]|nr:signal peptidase II [Nakamurella endophytica]
MSDAAGPTGGPADVPAAAGATPAPAADPRRRRRILLLAGLALAVVVVDLVTKIIVVRTLTPGVSPRILGGLVYFSLLRNPGAAFSMATGMTWVLSLVVVAVIVFILRMARRLRSTAWAVCLGLVLGGAVGNLIDRIFRAPGFLRGHVVDFISVFGPDARYFPAFNVADSAITVGGIALVVTALFVTDIDGRPVRGGRTRGGSDPVAGRREGVDG